MEAAYRVRISGWRWVASAAALAALPLVAFVAWHRADPASLHDAMLEDGPVENASAVAFLVAAVAFEIAARRAAPPVPARARLFLRLAALASLFFCGEELSWGQRLLGFETPSLLRELNQQQEFNVHNVGSLQWLKYTLLVTMVAVIGLLLPWGKALGLGRRLLAWSGIPVVPARYSGLFVATLVMLRNAANVLGLEHRNDAQEYGEMLFAAGILLFALHAAWRPRDVVELPAGGSGAAAPAQR